jgi:hypothetical protein
VTLLGLFILRTILASSVVPPWQGPDEPGHFSLAYSMAMPAVGEEQIRHDVLESMVHQRFWAFYDDPPPSPLVPENAYGIGWGTLSQPLYYSVASTVLRLSRPSTLEAAYYRLRGFGVVLAVLTIAIGWAGTRLLFGAEIAAGAATIAALHPQFLLAALTVNADALLNVCGAVVWWQAARVLTGQRAHFSMALMFIAAFAALFTKRVGLVLLVLAMVVAARALLMSRSWRMNSRDALLMTIGVVVGVATVLATWSYFSDESRRLWLYWVQLFEGRRAADTASLSEGARFARMTVDYFWLIGGWLRFQPPDAWLWIARTLMVAGAAGALIELATSSRWRVPLSIAGLFVVAQTTAMLAAVFWLAPSAPQARYLFPVFVPITVLLYVGLKRLVPHRYQAHWPVALVTLLMLLDVTGFTTVHLPTYLPW